MLRKFVAPLTALLMAGLACNVTGQGQAPAPEVLASAVAATLTASAPQVSVATFTPESGTAATTAPAASPTPAEYACPVVLGDSNTVLCLDGPNQGEIANTSALGPVQRVAVSSDGSRVAYVAGPFDGAPELWVVNGDGTNAHKLVGKEQLPPSQPDSVSWPRLIQWQAGTHTLFFDTGWTPTGGVGGPGEYLNLDLWQVNADTGNLTQVLTAGSGGLFSLSPNGQWIAISQPDSIDLISTDGATQHANVVSFPNIITYSEYAYKPQVTWSGDGAFFTVAVPSSDPLAPNPNATLYRVNVDGSTQTLSVVNGNFVFGAALRPSPDGQWVAYTYIPDPSNPQTYLYVAHADGSMNNGGLVPNGAQLHSWSPDSSWISYSVPNEGLYAAGHNGAGQLLAGLQAVKDVVWSDATSVVFSGSLNDHWGLRLAQVGGTFGDLAGPFSDTLVFAVRLAGE